MKKRKETDPHKFDDANGSTQYPLNGNPKSLIAHVRLNNHKSTDSRASASRVPLLPPTPKFVQLKNPPQTKNLREENPARDFDPHQKQDSKLHLTSPLPRFQRLPVKTNQRPKSHFNPDQHHYEFADGCQTLPFHNAGVKAPKPPPPPTQLKKTTEKEVPISHHYEVADGIGTTPPEYATPTIRPKVSAYNSPVGTVHSTTIAMP